MSILGDGSPGLSKQDVGTERGAPAWTEESWPFKMKRIIFLNHKLWEHWHNADIIGVSHEVYLYICFFKWNISIGYIEK